MDFAALKARLRLTVKQPDTTDLTDVDAGGYINSGYVDLCGRYPYHQTRKRCEFNTTSGEEKYQLPLDCSAVLRLKNMTLGYKLWKAGDRLVADRLSEHANELLSMPRRYVRYRNYVELVPTPDGVYTIEVFYLAVPVLLDAAIDTPILPISWHDGIWMRAKWYYYMDRGDIAQQTNALNQYKVWLLDKPSEIDEESRDIDSGVELPELTRNYSPSLSRRFDDGYFDYRD